MYTARFESSFTIPIRPQTHKQLQVHIGFHVGFFLPPAVGRPSNMLNDVGTQGVGRRRFESGDLDRASELMGSRRSGHGQLGVPELQASSRKPQPSQSRAPRAFHSRWMRTPRNLTQCLWQCASQRRSTFLQPRPRSPGPRGGMVPRQGTVEETARKQRMRIILSATYSVKSLFFSFGFTSLAFAVVHRADGPYGPTQLDGPG
ncbi:hypothetical protein DFH06DRAFT_511740 [Mycena polygramma]|nr:hypothetical protein DFH06DRAFT_511740 [Mycena polygramma]